MARRSCRPPHSYDAARAATPHNAVLANTEGTPIALNSTIGDPSQWSDLNGTFGTNALAALNAAASNVTAVGLSFGGGCFAENGVGTADGSGSFTVTAETH